MFTDDLCNISNERLVSGIMGRKAEEQFPVRSPQIGDVIFQAEDITSYGKFEDVSFQVRKGEILGFAGLAGAGQSEGRTKGFKETVEANDKFNLVAVQNCDWDATLAYDATKALITEHPDLKGIFCCNDTMALAAVEALAAEGKEGVLVYGVDFTDDAREAIKAGTMTGSMSYSSARYTKAALQMAVMLNEGQTFDSYVYLPLTLVNVDNVNDLEGWK